MPNGLKVLGRNVFNGCASLKSIEIPQGVTVIQAYTFANCQALTSVEILNGVTMIGDHAFYNCASLKSIIIPNTVTSMGNYSFANCTSLESMTLPFIGSAISGEGKTHFGYIFGANDYSGQKSYVPTSLKTVIITVGGKIADYAFYNCSSITNISIPDTVEYVGNSAFSGCSVTYTTYENCKYLGNENNNYVVLVQAIDKTAAEFTIHANTKVIAGRAFMECTELTRITIPEGVTSIGKVAFRYCTKLKEIDIPNSVVSIGEYAFGDCEALENVTIGSGVVTIGKGAFSTCEALKNVIISSSVKTIEEYAFFNSVITNVYYTGTSSQWYSINIKDSNEPLESASITFNYVIE